MKDQAEKLRRISKKIISVASGKGGVGKTTIAVNLAYGISQTGRKTLLVDADLTLANADLILGITPKKHIGHYLEGNISLNELIEKINDKLDFIAGSSGIVKLNQLTENQMKKIKNIFNEWDGNIIILDLPAGIGKNVINFSLISQAVIVVINPDPVSITDSYALSKVISKSGFQGKIFVVVNMVSNPREKDIAFFTFRNVCQKYLGITPELLGSIPFDESVRESFRMQKLLINSFPKSKASESIKKMIQEIISKI
ncbi:Flagellum site-determining protein YlxH [bacterium HR19]|nr:Flagellum site-determining protein YlxH [bacterium HR19]